MLPYVIIGDEAFRLSNHILKPYSRKHAQHDEHKNIFNYRLCTARKVSENAFELLSQIFRVFYTTISLMPVTIDDLILASCCLHNFLINSKTSIKYL